MKDLVKWILMLASLPHVIGQSLKPFLSSPDPLEYDEIEYEPVIGHLSTRPVHSKSDDNLSRQSHSLVQSQGFTEVISENDLAGAYSYVSHYRKKKFTCNLYPRHHPYHKKCKSRCLKFRRGYRGGCKNKKGKCKCYR